MGAVKGASQHKKFKEGKRLTRKESMLAMCYDCNGLEESAQDCLGVSCPLYAYSPYKGKKNNPRN
jgi:hypothetical protein